MAITSQELVSDLPQLLALYEAAKAAYTAMPASPKGVDYGTALGLAAGSPGAILLGLIDTLAAQAKS